MKIKVVNNTRDFDRLKASWNDIVEKADVHIFQTFEWNRTWWKYFGIEENLHLILFYDNDRLVGIAPLFWDPIHLLGKKFYRCLRFIGSNIYQPKGEALIGLISYSDYLDFIVEPGYEKQVALSFIQCLKDEDISFDEILFEEVPEQSLILSYIIPMLNTFREPIYVEDASSCASITLEKTWDDYLKTLKSRDRNKVRKYFKKLEDEHEKIFNVGMPSDHSQLSEAYEKLVAIHQDQWNSQNFAGFFYEKRMYEFMKEISRDFFDKNWMFIKEITSIDGKTHVGIYLLFRFKKRLYGIIGGINQHSPLSSEGIGHIALNESLKEAIEQEFEVFDFIRGLQDYKLRVANNVTTNKTVLLPHPELNGSRKAQVEAVKKLSKLQRRIRVEVIQFKLSFRNKGLSEGLKHYSSFISQRIKHKRAALAS